MSTLNPKQFIQNVLINEIGEIHMKYPYVSFAIMAIGIEFLGKCLNGVEDWNKSGRCEKDFNLAINSLNSLSTYRPLLKSHALWDSLRNGFLHSFVPKNTIRLSSKSEAEHLQNITSTQINIKCENFYEDFKGACEEVIKMTTFPSKKMGKPLLEIPDITSATVKSTTANNASTQRTQILVPPLSQINTSGSTS